jgi:hypothetical protein
MDPAALRNKVLVKALRSPVVILPTLLGTWALATAALLGDVTGFFGFLGLTGLVLGVGSGVTRLMLGSSRYATEAVQEVRQAKIEAGEERLRAVERRLEKTREPAVFEDIRLLRQLRRRVIDAVESKAFPVPPEIVSQGEQLYRSCVDSLERSAALWETARNMATAEARDDLMQKRQVMLEEVGRSVHQWARTIDAMEAAPLKRGADDLSQLRDEMSANVEVARRVEERMGELERDLSGRRLAE